MKIEVLFVLSDKPKPQHVLTVKPKSRFHVDTLNAYSPFGLAKSTLWSQLAGDKGSEDLPFHVLLLILDKIVRILSFYFVYCDF